MITRQRTFTTEFVSALPSSDWKALREAVAPDHRLFATEAWYAAWADAFLPGDRWRGPLRYLVTRTPEGIVAGILPLATLSIARLELTALGGIYQPMRSIPLARADLADAATALADTLVTHVELPALRLAACEEPDEGVDAFLRRLREHGWALFESTSGYSYCLRLPPSFAEFEASLNKTMKGIVRRYERKLEKAGRVEHCTYNALDSAKWAQVVEDLGTIEERSWLSSGGDMRFAGAANRRFWARFLGDEEASASTFAFVIYLDDRPVSFAFGIDSGPTRYMLANQYDQAVASYSTGQIIRMRMFENACAQKVELVNFGVGDSGYKRHWGSEPRKVVRDFVACRPSLRGRALYAGLMAKSAFDQLRRPAHPQGDESEDKSEKSEKSEKSSS